MNLDRILEFFFRRIGGLLIAGISATLMVLSLTGCIPLDFLGCLCYSVGCQECAESCVECSDGIDIVCYECTTLGCDDGADGNCKLQACLFLPEGCVSECGDSYTTCGGVNQTLCYTCYINGFNCKSTEEDGHKRYSCLNCYTYCDGVYDPASPNYNHVKVGTVTLFDYNGTVWDVVDIYLNTSSLYYESSIYDASIDQYIPFYGYFSEPNGQGVQYTDSQGRFIDGTYPTSGTGLYPYYKNPHIDEQYLIILKPVGDESFEFEYDRIVINYGDNFENFLPRLVSEANAGRVFNGWYTSVTYPSDSRISQGDTFSPYTRFDPYYITMVNGMGYSTSLNSTYETYEEYEGESYRTYYLYAYFAPQSLDVTLHYIGIDLSSSTVSTSYGNLIKDVVTPGEWIGYSFIGLYTDSNCYFEVADDDRVTEETNVYALYAKNVEITFVDDYGTVIKTDKYPIGYSSALPEYSKDGHIFLGWEFVEPMSYGVGTYTELYTYEYHNGAVMKPSWKTAEYNITYMVNGRELSVRPSESIYYYGEATSLIEGDTAMWGLTYYTFLGWYDNEEFVGSPYTAITATDFGDKVFYAKLNPISIELTCDTGLGNTYTSTILYGNTFNLVVPTRDKYTFLGWYIGSVQVTDRNGQSLDALEAGKIGFTDTDMQNGYAILEAKWERTRYTVTFYADGEIFYTATGIYGDTVAVPTEIPTKEGYDFSHWRHNWTEVTSIQVTGNTSVEAVFVPKTYTVYFFNNDGSGEFVTTTYSHNESSISFAAPTREGYTFTGWCSDEAGTTVLIYANGEVSRAFPWNVDGVELYARWLELDPVNE